MSGEQPGRAGDGVWDCGIECPADWLPLPLGPGVDIGAWAAERSAELGGSEALVHDLREHAADSRSRAPVLAFALCPEGLDAVLALLEVDLIHPDRTVPEITLDWITEIFTASDFAEPRIDRAALPAGPAVRISQVIAGRGVGPAGERGLLETVTYGVLPPAVGSAVMVLMSWTAPGLTEVLTGAADRMVGTLSVTGADGSPDGGERAG